MQKLGTCLKPFGSSLTGTIAKYCIPVVVTLLQSHTLAAKQVNRGPNFHFELSDFERLKIVYEVLSQGRNEAVAPFRWPLPFASRACHAEAAPSDAE